jgi:bifunctional ADP-heptose synthase (sugar kinase/adenylyltransferase)
LIVGLNDNSLMSMQDQHPFLSIQEWAHIISALDCVDFVVLFSEDTPQRLINLIKPQIVVKGEGLHQEGDLDWEAVRNYGAEIKAVNVNT